MGLEFLRRVRHASIGLVLIASLIVATYRDPALGLALIAGAGWSLVNLLLIEKLVVALTGLDRGTKAALRPAVLALGGMLGLFVAGALLLACLSPPWLMVGFSIPMAVIFLKAASMLLLPSRAWQRLVTSRWRAAGIVAALALGAWVASGAMAQGQHGGAAAQGRAAHGARSEGPEKFANFITIIARAFPDAPWAHFLHQYETLIFSLLIAFLLCLVAFVASRNPQMIPGPLQNLVEMLVEKLHDFVIGILGAKRGPRYVPFLGTLFLYILAMNLFGLIPFMDSPTSSLNVTVALALVVFLFAQFIGLKELGVVGYLDHLAGNPRTLLGWGLVPIMLPIHVMGELAKPISLSCRLFGNIFGEDMLLVAFVSLGITTLSFTHLPFGLPLQLPFLFLALLTSTLQALVFTVLSTIYFLLMLPHEEHGHEGEALHAH